MKKLRINVGEESAIEKIFDLDIHEKDSAGFIEDVTFSGTIQPTLNRISDEDAWRIYRGNDWVFSVVNRIVRDCVKVQPKVVPKDQNAKVSGRLKERIRIIEEFLNNPNNNKEPFQEIREKVIKDLLIYGRAGLEKVLSLGRKLIEIYSQCPKYLKINCDIHGNIPTERAYLLEAPQGDVWFDIDELIHMIFNPCSNSIYGLKVLDAIANSVASDILRAAYNSNFFINNAEASGIIGLEGMPNEKLKKFRSEWGQNFKGVKNAHKVAAVNVPVTYARMALTNRDLEFSEYGNELRSKIFSAYSMQPVVMGIMDKTSGKLNAGEQIELYKDGALRPVLSKESYYYTQEIVQMGFGYTDVMISFPSIDMIDKVNQRNVDREDINLGILTINEVRATRGLGPVPWGDTPISTMPGGGQVDPNTGKLIPPSQQGAGTAKPKPKPKKSKEI